MWKTKDPKKKTKTTTAEQVFNYIEKQVTIRKYIKRQKAK